jgi:hypothetical protein
LAGALQYLTLTRPDLSHAVQQMCLFMHAHRESHFQLVKRILRYVQATSHLGLQLHANSSSDLVDYSDADCRVPRHTTLDVWLLCVPWLQPRVVVIQTTTHRLHVQRRGRIPRHLQLC